MLRQLLHLSRPAALQDGLRGDGGGRAEGPDGLLRLRGLGRVSTLLRRRPQPGGVLPAYTGQGRQPGYAGKFFIFLIFLQILADF